tara:strand:+ start:24 stop:503 length:480 start_codon:yes stop_codon:yes gene_type:complete
MDWKSMDWKLFAIAAMILNSLILLCFDFLTQNIKDCFELIILIYGSVGILCLLLYFGKEKKTINLDKKHLLIFLLIAVLYLFWGYSILTAIQNAPHPSYAQAINFIHILIVVIIYSIFFGKKINSKVIFGMILMIVGLFIVLNYSKNEEKTNLKNDKIF